MNALLTKNKKAVSLASARIFQVQKRNQHFRPLFTQKEYDPTKKQIQQESPYAGWSEVNENPTQFTENFDLAWNNAYRQEEWMVMRSEPYRTSGQITLDALWFIGWFAAIGWAFMAFFKPRQEIHTLTRVRQDEFDSLKEYIESVKEKRIAEMEEYGIEEPAPKK